MRRFKLLPIVALMATAMSTAQAQTDLMVQSPSALEKTSSTASPSSETDLTFSGHIEAMDTFFSNDYFDCWNDGVAAKCGRTPNLLQGENWVRLDGVRDLNDNWSLVFRGQISAYLNNAWYTASKAARVGENYGDAPRLRAEVEDTWLGIKHSDFGTVRIGRGLNPYLQALEGDGTTDLGGGEMLNTMVAYDSPYLLGEKSNGIKFNYAHYDGSHRRKEILVFSPSEKDAANHLDPVGNALLIDAAWRGKLNAKLAVYRESYAAKSYYGDGVLDGTPISAGSYEVIPGSGALTHSHGIAALAIYEFTGYKLGLSASQNQRDKVTLVNDKFPTLDYKSNFVTAFMSAWQGRWGMYAKVSGARFRTENATFTDGYDWLYANNNFDVQQVGGEVSYEFMKATKAVVGFDWRKYHFYESPDANGMCDVNKSHPCYNPKGAKVFAGIRADF